MRVEGEGGGKMIEMEWGVGEKVVGIAPLELSSVLTVWTWHVLTRRDCHRNRSISPRTSGMERLLRIWEEGVCLERRRARPGVFDLDV